MKRFYFIILFFQICSCEKEEFVHSEKQIYFPCACCQMADSIEGTYDGHLVKMEYAGFVMGIPSFDTILDTMIVFDVTRTWENSNYIEDSTVCKFLVPSFYDEPIRLTDNSGKYSPHIYPSQKFTLSGSLSFVGQKTTPALDNPYVSMTLSAQRR